jgi:hypothetical protein
MSSGCTCNLWLRVGLKGGFRHDSHGKPWMGPLVNHWGLHLTERLKKEDCEFQKSALFRN